MGKQLSKKTIKILYFPRYRLQARDKKKPKKQNSWRT